MVVGIILAGGKSTRMGTDKGSLKINDLSFIEKIHRTMTFSNSIDDIIISSSHKKHTLFGKTITDQKENIGPLGGIYSVYKTLNADKYLVIACDTPFITTHSIDKLIEGKNNIATSKGKTHPTIACYNHAALRHLETQIADENYALMKWIKTFNHNLIEIPESETRNINTLEDYKNIK